MMTVISYSGYRFPSEIIQQAIWLYVRFTLSFRDVEDLLVERGIVVSYETVRRWVNHFGPKIAADLRKRRPKPHTTWTLLSIVCVCLTGGVIGFHAGFCLTRTPRRTLPGANGGVSGAMPARCGAGRASV